jgi:hypothetical protein
MVCLSKRGLRGDGASFQRACHGAPFFGTSRRALPDFLDLSVARQRTIEGVVLLFRVWAGDYGVETAPPANSACSCPTGYRRSNHVVGGVKAMRRVDVVSVNERIAPVLSGNWVPKRTPNDVRSDVEAPGRSGRALITIPLAFCVFFGAPARGAPSGCFEKTSWHTSCKASDRPSALSRSL